MGDDVIAPYGPTKAFGTEGGTMNVHVGRTLGALATAGVVAILPLTSAGAVGAERDGAHVLSVVDAPYYLDVHDKVPPSFRQLTPDELTEIAGEQPPDSAAAGYTTEDGDAFLVLTFTVGKGRSAWSAFQHDLAHAEEAYRGEDLAHMLTDADLSSDQITVAPVEWTDVATGDAARTALFNVDIAGLGTIHFEVLVMAVRSGADAALVVVAHAFVVAPALAVTDIADEIAARVKSGPPSPERTIAQAGLVSIGDLPAGWSERTVAASDPAPPSTTEGATEPTDGDRLGPARTAAKSIPSCKTFVAVLDGSGRVPAQNGTRDSNELTLDGPEFSLGPATASSGVMVYPTSASANEFFRLLRVPSTKACLTKLYAKITTDGLNAPTTNSRQRRAKAATVRVEVTTPHPSPVGDDRLLFRVSAEVPSLGHVRVVSEQEYVRTGRAVAQYTFSDVERVSIRDDVVRAASERLAAAPGVRRDR